MTRANTLPEVPPMIDTGRDGDVRQWANLLNTSPVRVKIAVAAVGANADRVRDFIATRNAPAQANVHGAVVPSARVADDGSGPAVLRPAMKPRRATSGRAGVAGLSR